MKIYKSSFRNIVEGICVSIIIFSIGLMMIFLLATEVTKISEVTEVIYRIIGGIGGVLVGIYLFLISITNKKIIQIEDEYILFFFQGILTKFRRKILWKNVVAVYTLPEYSSAITYLFSSIIEEKCLDTDVIRLIQQGKENKKTREYLNCLITKRYAIEIPREIKNYYDLIKEICHRATNAIIDEETRQRAEGKEPALNLSIGTRKMLKRFWRKDKQIKPAVLDSVFLKERKKENIKKPIKPGWFIPLSIFFSFFVAGIIASFNYGRFNKSDKGRKILWGTLGIAILTIVLVSFSFSLKDAIGIIFTFNILGGIILQFLQWPDYAKWKLKNEFK